MQRGGVISIGVTNSKLSDKICLGSEEMVLSATAQSLPFTGINSADVGSVLIKCRKIGTPTDSTYLLRYTQTSGITATTILGMWMGDGDVFEINNNANVVALKLIATDALFCKLSIEYYGK
jgi:hypothetical protein